MPSNVKIGVALGKGGIMSRIIISVVLAFVLLSCSGDPNEHANKLFVEAQQLIEKADKQRPDKRLQALYAADEMLKTIVAKYPSANLAVQLASGQSIGKISLAAVSEMIAEAAWDACLRTLKRLCVLDQALKVAQTIKDEEPRAVILSAIAEGQAKAGLRKEAAATLDQAIQLAQGIENEDPHASALRAIAEAQAKTGLRKEAAVTLDQAIQVAQTIKDEWARAWALLDLCAVQSRAGFIIEALQLAQNMTDEGRRARALLYIAEALPN